MKKNNKKGFTLAELLIVVAIIAVLVAVAIPVFTTQLEKSRDGVSVSNLRSAYAEAMTTILTYTSDTTEGNVTIAATAGTNGAPASYTVSVANVVIKSQVADNWSNQAVELPWNNGTGNAPTDPGKPATYALGFTYTIATGAISNVTLTEA